MTPQHREPLEELVTIVYPPLETDGQDKRTRSLAADLDYAKRYHRIELSLALGDLDQQHISHLLAHRREALHRLIEELIEYENGGCPLSVGMIASRIRTLAVNGSHAVVPSSR